MRPVIAMSDDNTTKASLEDDVKAVADKIADAAPSVSPSDLKPADALAGVKKIDQTILRINKYVWHKPFEDYSTRTLTK